MTSNKTSIEVSFESQSFNKIEEFVEYLCDQLLINDTYYGNILMVLTEVYIQCKNQAGSETLKISYNTDYQTVTINIQPLDNQLIKVLQQDLDVANMSDESISRLGFLVQSLTDNIVVKGDDEVDLVFDISALHNKVYNHRQEQLDNFFNIYSRKSVKKSDDTL